MHIIWKTIHGLSNIAPPLTLNNSITFNNKITTTPKYCELYNQTITNTQHTTNISINRVTHKRQGYNITLTTAQIQEAIKQSKNSISQSRDKLNIRHLKHIGPLGLVFLMSMLKPALNTNIIPPIWKLANIIPISKPNKDINKGTGEEPSSLPNSKHTKHTQHGYETQQSTVTALDTLNNTVAKGSTKWLSCANNHCSTRYEQIFQHNKHTHTNQRTATTQDSRHNHSSS